MPPKKLNTVAVGAADGIDEDAHEDQASLHPDRMSSSRTTHSREKLSLCQQIVLDHFGPVAATVTSLLLQRGRLSLAQLQRFILSQGQAAASTGPSSSSSPTHSPSQDSIQPQKSQILQTILVLVQHNLLYHVRLDADGSIIRNRDEVGGVEYFEINPEAILTRNRFGSFMETAERLWQGEGLNIVRLILLHGKLQISDILTQLPHVSPHTRPLLTYMLFSAYLLPSSFLTHVSPHELTIAYTLEAKKKYKGVPGPKDMKIIEAQVRDRIVEERANDRATGVRHRTAADNGQARASTSSSKTNGKKRTSTSRDNGRGRNKKLAVRSSGSDSDSDDAEKSRGKQSQTSRTNANAVRSGGNSDIQTSNVGEQILWMQNLSDFERERLDEIIVDEDVFVRVNYDRFDVHIRNDLLEGLTRNHFNREASEVYMKIAEAADTRKIENGSWPSVADLKGEPVSLNILSASFPPTFNLKSGFHRNAFDDLSNGRKMSRFDLICEYVALLSRTEDTITRNFQVDRRDLAQATSATRFLLPGTTSTDIMTPTGSRVSGSAIVDYSAAARKLKWNMLKQTIESVFGEVEGKVMGVLRREGKLEEKQINKLAMLTSPEVREACNSLFSAGVLALQEVPKSADRNPQRTFFLYYIDYPRALAWLSDRLHRTQARLAQRRAKEREKAKLLLAKIDRTDVQSEGVEKVLSANEKRRLKECRGRLQLLTVQLGRVEKESWVLARMAG